MAVRLKTHSRLLPSPHSDVNRELSRTKRKGVTSFYFKPANFKKKKETKAKNKDLIMKFMVLKAQELAASDIPEMEQTARKMGWNPRRLTGLRSYEHRPGPVQGNLGLTL